MTAEYLEMRQNILDQEPFKTVILRALKDPDRERYFQHIESLTFPPLKKDNSWEEWKREEKQIAAQCFLINGAVKRPDIPLRLRGLSTHEERRKLFEWDNEFGSVLLAPLKTGLPKDVDIDIYTSAGSLEFHELFINLMITMADYPGWDAYLRKFRKSVNAYGEPRNKKCACINMFSES